MCQKNFPTTVASVTNAGYIRRNKGFGDFYFGGFQVEMSYFCRLPARVDLHLTIKHTERRKNLSYRQCGTTKKVLLALAWQGNGDPVILWRLHFPEQRKKTAKPVARLAALFSLSSWTITCGVLHGLRA